RAHRIASAARGRQPGAVLPSDGYSLWPAISALRRGRGPGHCWHGSDADLVGQPPHPHAVPGRTPAVSRLMLHPLPDPVLHPLARPQLALRWLKFNAVGAMGIAVQFAAFG